MATETASSPKTLFKQIATLSVPLALHNVGHSLLGIVDSAFVGRLGHHELAAVSLGNLLLFTVLVMGMGIIFGTEPLIAQAIGRGRHGQVQSAARNGLVLALLLTPLVWLAMLVIVAALPLFHVDETVIELTEDYLWGRALGVPFFLAFTALRAVLQGYGQTRAIVLGMVLANFLNLPADLLLIFGDDGLRFLGLPTLGFSGLGVLGAGLASALASLLQLVAVLHPSRKLWRLHPERRQVDRVRTWAVLRLGIPVGLQYGAEVGMFAAVGVAMGAIGPRDLAAHQIALALASVSFRLIMGISTATSVVVGLQVGAAQTSKTGPHQGALHAGIAGIGLGAAIMIASGAVFLIFPGALARLFTEDERVIAAAIPLLRIAAAFQLSDGLQGVAGGALRGAGDPSWAFAINLVSYWLIAFPFALWLAFPRGLGGNGLWWGLTLGLTCAAVGQVARFVVRARRGYDPAPT